MVGDQNKPCALGWAMQGTRRRRELSQTQLSSKVRQGGVAAGAILVAVRLLPTEAACLVDPLTRQHGLGLARKGLAALYLGT